MRMGTRTRMGAALSLAMACAAASGCAERAGSEELWDDAPEMRRQVLVQRWDTLWSIGGNAADTTLLRPFLVAADAGTVYVYDGLAKRVTAYASDGAVRWRFGRPGKGPDEFDKVRDMRLSADGGIDLLDPRNNRILRLTPGGTVRARVPLGAVGHAEQMVPVSAAEWVLMTPRPDAPFVTVDSAGRVRGTVPIHWAGFHRLDPLARQGMLAGRAGGWVFAFSFGDGWFRFRGTAPDTLVGRFVEHTPFPAVESVPVAGGRASRMDGYHACSACSVTLWDSTLYVHFGGYSDVAQRVVDLYGLGDGAYRGSWILPREARTIEVADGRLYALVENPFPELLALRPRRDER